MENFRNTSRKKIRKTLENTSRKKIRKSLENTSRKKIRKTLENASRKKIRKTLENTSRKKISVFCLNFNSDVKCTKHYKFIVLFYSLINSKNSWDIKDNISEFRGKDDEN